MVGQAAFFSSAGDLLELECMKLGEPSSVLDDADVLIDELDRQPGGRWFAQRFSRVHRLEAENPDLQPELVTQPDWPDEVPFLDALEDHGFFREAESGGQAGGNGPPEPAVSNARLETRTPGEFFVEMNRVKVSRNLGVSRHEFLGHGPCR